MGNGTASRESEAWIAAFIKKYHLDVQYVIVSEAGASVYSASKLAKEEFPDFAVEERSAVFNFTTTSIYGWHVYKPSLRCYKIYR